MSWSVTCVQLYVLVSDLCATMSRTALPPKPHRLPMSPEVPYFCFIVQAPSEKNTLVFKLDVTCTRQGTKLVNEKGA